MGEQRHQSGTDDKQSGVAASVTAEQPRWRGLTDGQLKKHQLNIWESDQGRRTDDGRNREDELPRLEEERRL